MPNDYQLNINNNLVERLFELSPDLIYVLDLKLRKLIFVSNRITDVLGYSLADIQEMGNSFESIMLVNDPEFAVNISNQFDALKTGEEVKFIMDFRHKNGQVRTLRNRGTVLEQDEEGRNWHIMLTAEDITEVLKQMKISQKQQNHLNESERLFKYGSWEWKSSEDKVFWSDGLFELIGISKDDFPDGYVPRDYYLSHIPGLERNLVEETAYKNISDHVSYYEITHSLLNSKGQIREMVLRSQVIEEGTEVSVVGTVLDVTDKKRIEQELQRQVLALNKSNQDLEQFAYVASHDLQEPLRKIRTFGERLEKKHKDQLNAEGQFFVERMTNAAQRMHQLIEDLLAYSRASQQTEPYKQISLQKIAEQVLEDLELKIQEKQAQIFISPLPTIDAQPAQMHQVLLNLIENALKFSQTNTTPQIRVQARRASSSEIKRLVQLDWQKDYIRLSIGDNGIGFEAEYAERIFNIFQRLHGRSEYAGTGLGLAICRKIIETHHGHIEAFGQLGKGAEFVCYLPNTQ